MTPTGTVSLSWAAVYLAFLATPAFCFHLGSRVSPYYHRTFTDQAFLYLSGYILIAVTIHLGVIYLWDLVGLQPDANLGLVFELFNRVPNAKDLKGSLRPFIWYGVVVNVVGFAAGAIYKWALIILYKQKHLYSWTEPAHPLAYTLKTWSREPFQRQWYRAIVCHVLTKIASDAPARPRRILYIGILSDAEFDGDGNLVSLTLVYPAKQLLATSTGKLRAVGTFDPYFAKSKLLLQLPLADIENVIYEFVENDLEVAEALREVTRPAPPTQAAPALDT